MPTELPHELSQALAASSGGTLKVIDPITQKAYIIVSAEIYERIQALFSDDADMIPGMSGMLADLAPEDWEDAANYESPSP